MALHKRTLDSVRDLLDEAEEIDINLTGGTFLRDADVDLYTDALLREIRETYGTTVEIEHFEKVVNGVVLSVLPQHKTTAVYLHCKNAWRLVSDVRYDAKTGSIVVTFNLRAPVYFCSTLFSVVAWGAVSAACAWAGAAFASPWEIVEALALS